MRMPPLRILTLMTAVAGVSLVLAAITARQPKWDRYTVENHSGQWISRFQVTIGGRTVIHGNVAEAAPVSGAYRASREDQFVFAGRLADGTELNAQIAFYTKT